MEEEIAYIKGQMEGNKPEVEKNGIQKKSSSNLTAKEIKFDDFDKVEIRVAEVKEVSKVEGSDKLLQFPWMLVTVMPSSLWVGGARKTSHSTPR